MTINHWLETNTQKLENEGIATARLDCLVLLADELKKDKSWILAHLDFECKGPTLTSLKSHIERRVKHEPLAYIRGKSEFYGREFMVTPHTLEPRPETETMIDLLKSHFSSEVRVRPLKIPLKIVDVGTGSGCLSITAKLELPECMVVGVDISKKCLETAKNNAKKLTAEVNFYQGNLLEALPSTIYHLPSTRLAILANLPYVPDKHTINRAAMFEPKLAIFGGEDGLDLYRQMFNQIKELKNKPIYVFSESLPFQHKELAHIAKSSGYKLETSEDFIQLFIRG